MKGTSKFNSHVTCNETGLEYLTVSCRCARQKYNPVFWTFKLFMVRTGPVTRIRLSSSIHDKDGRPLPVLAHVITTELPCLTRPSFVATTVGVSNSKKV